MLSHFRTLYILIKSVENWQTVLTTYLKHKRLVDIEVKFRKYPIKLYVEGNSFLRPSHIVNLFSDLNNHNIKLADSVEIIVKKNETHLYLNDKKITLPADENSFTFSIPRWIIFSNRGGKILDFDKKLVEIYGYKFLLPDFKNGIYEIVEMFIDDVYGKFDYKNKVVLDVGGFIGDSAIYFLHKGAKEVITYEPNPLLYDLLVKNLKINNLTDRVVAYNFGIGKENKVVRMKIPWLGVGSIYDWNTNKCDEVNVKVVSIKDVMEKFKNKIDIIKLDCEGCEYDILKYFYENQSLIKNVEGIILEAHYIGDNYPRIAIKILNKIGMKVYHEGNLIWGMFHS